MKIEIKENFRKYSGRIHLKNNEYIDLAEAHEFLKDFFEVFYNPESNLKQLIIKPTPILTINLFSSGYFNIYSKEKNDPDSEFIKNCLIVNRYRKFAHHNTSKAMGKEVPPKFKTKKIGLNKNSFSFPVSGLAGRKETWPRLPARQR